MRSARGFGPNESYCFIGYLLARSGISRAAISQRRIRVGIAVNGHEPYVSTMTNKRRTTRIRGAKARPTAPRRWSNGVTQRSNALDLERGVFLLGDPRKVAASLKRSAE